MSRDSTTILGTHIQCMKRGKRENQVGRETPPKNIIKNVEKRKLLSDGVLHHEMISQKSNLPLTECIDLKISTIFLDLEHY